MDERPVAVNTAAGRSVVRRTTEAESLVERPITYERIHCEGRILHLRAREFARVEIGSGVRRLPANEHSNDGVFEFSLERQYPYFMLKKLGRYQRPDRVHLEAR